MKILTLLLFFVSTGINGFSQSENLLIVKFNYAYLDLSKIDDRERLTGTVGDFLNSYGHSEIESLHDSYPEILSFEMKKAFPNLTSKDTVSISRQGYEVPIPPFWAAFQLYVDSSIPAYELLHDLNRQTKLIEYAHPNYKVELTSVPNDTTYFKQNNLNGSIPNADINVEEAWDIETGEPWIKVAVHDNGIDSNNVDLDVLFGGGYDGSNFPETSWGFNGDHGTPVAGIIGAKRDNTTGIAGIAGGDSTDTSGVSLIDIRYSFVSTASISNFMAGVVDAARSVGTYWDYPSNYNDAFSNFYDYAPGFGVQTGNHSYIIRTDIPMIIGEGKIPDDGNELVSPDCNICREAFLFSLRNGVINVVARGNSGNLATNQPPTQIDNFFPQSLPDEWIILVGASGYDGGTIQQGINQSQFEANINFYSLYGADMDVVAPGSDTLVYTTGETINATPDYFDEFNGTSAAAPHVTGVVALLLSHYNQPCYNRGNLSFEDVEYIIENSATDLYGAGYDDTSGWGRLNAGEALKMIEHPLYQIVHPDSLISSTVIANDTISLRYHEALTADDWGPISTPWPLERLKNYQVERLLVENVYDISNFITPTTEILDSWPNPSISNAVEFYRDTIWYPDMPIFQDPTIIDTVILMDTFDLAPFTEIVFFDTAQLQVRTRGYYYHFIAQYVDLEGFVFNDPTTWGPEDLVIFPFYQADYWYPVNPVQDTARLPFSMYVRDSSLLQLYQYPCDSINALYDSIIYNILNTGEDFKIPVTVYPNPFSESITIEFGGLSGRKSLELMDIRGAVISNYSTSSERMEITTDTLSSGVYLLNCRVGEEMKTFKIIKR